MTPEEAMRAAFRNNVHTPHAILTRLREMGYTVTPEARADALDFGDGVRIGYLRGRAEARADALDVAHLRGVIATALRERKVEIDDERWVLDEFDRAILAERKP